MRKILLDTNVIIRYPKFLGLHIPDTDFVITKDVMNELMVRTVVRGGLHEEWVIIINNAIAEKTIEVIDTAVPEAAQHQSEFAHQGMDSGDSSLITAALVFRSKGYDVIIASFDSLVRNIALSLGIEPFGELDIKRLLNSAWQKSPPEKPFSNKANVSAPETNIKEEILHFERRQDRQYVISLSVGVISSVITAITLKTQAYTLLPGIKVWGTVAIILAGFGLFYWRERDKKSYGAFELFGGIATILFVLNSVSFDIGVIYPDLEKDFKVLGGTYIMVRGLDNIVNGVYGSKFGVWLYEKLKIGKKS